MKITYLFEKTMIVLTFIAIICIREYNRKIYKEAVDREYKLATTTIKDTNENQNQILNNYFDEKIKELKLLASFPQIYHMNEDEQWGFIEGKHRYISLNNIFIIYADGKSYYPNQNKDRHRDDDFTKKALTREIAIKKPSHHTYEATVTIAVSIYNENKTKVGALCGKVDLKKVQDLLNENKSIYNDISYAIDLDGYYVKSMEYADVLDKRNFFDDYDTEDLKQAILNKQSITTIGYQKKNKKIINAIYNENLNWIMIRVIDTSDLIKTAAKYEKSNKIELCFMIFLIMSIFSICFCFKRSLNKIKQDNLTKCDNRISLDLDKEKIKKKKYTLIYFDLNNFKQINDNYGHKKGDEALIAYVEVLKKNFKKKGKFYRVGGDEFIGILKEHYKEIEDFCKQINKELDKIDIGIDWRLSTSYGYVYGEKKDDINKKIEEADKKMYEYKKQHKKEPLL